MNFANALELEVVVGYKLLIIKLCLLGTFDVYKKVQKQLFADHF